MNELIDCKHINNNNESSIIFEKNKWTGVYPRKIKGICSLCGKQFSLTVKEYHEYMNGGEII